MLDAPAGCLPHSFSPYVVTLNVCLLPPSPNEFWTCRRCFRRATNATGPFAYLTAYFLWPRHHFAVPGADSGGGCDDDGERGSDRPLFPSCQEYFLDFVALSKWLLEQLAGGGGGYAGFESAATDSPVAVCADILQACQVCPLASLGWLISTAGRS